MSAVAKYLQSYENYFWQYEDRGKVIAVPNGLTLGYSEHIINEIIIHLAPQGLPRFGSLLLALAATNSQGVRTINDIVSVIVYRSGSDEIENGIQFAKLLAELPVRYKKGNLRLELLREIFSGSHNSISKKKSLQILREIKNNPSIATYPSALNKLKLSELQLANQISLDFKTLGIIGRKLDSFEAIMARLSMLPNLDQELAELDLELEKQAEQVDLVEDLTNNYETFHVGALVSSLISGLHIPFHSSLPSEQPLGGVADITNKGSFDQLLISEFANEDYILMSRLANNESLYHHREVSPADNNYSRVILIDTTLKNWGAIRAISFATMLAITNHPKNRNPNRVFLVGKSYKEIEFETVHDILDALQTLDSSLDPGIGLNQLFTTEPIDVSEIFFIGSAESLTFPNMQRFSAELGKRIDHWIHPNEKGEITVYKNPKRGKRFIQELKIPLDKLWVKPQRKNNQTITHFDNDYPILFPYAKIKTRWDDQIYTYFVTRHKSLLRQDRNTYPNHEGLKMISTKFPSNDILKAVMTHSDLSVTVLVAQHKQPFCLVNYPSGNRITVKDFRQSKAFKKFSTEGNLFKCSSHSKTFFIDLEGNVIEKTFEFKIDENTTNSYSNSAIYQNIKWVFISNENQLHFGKQDLVLNGPKLNLMHSGKVHSVKINAIQESIGLFKFPDGSSIVHDKNGMLTLISSSSSIPKIYVPCVLNSPLGMATENIFAGERFYQMKYKIELMLSEDTTNRLAVTKIVKDQLCDITLKHAKEMVVKGVIASTDELKMQELMKQLDFQHITYTIRKTGLQQEVISPYEFYNSYIKEFINQIVSYGPRT